MLRKNKYPKCRIITPINPIAITIKTTGITIIAIRKLTTPIK